MILEKKFGYFMKNLKPNFKNNKNIQKNPKICKIKAKNNHKIF